MQRMARVFRRFSWKNFLQLKLFSFCVLFPVALAAFLAASSLVIYQRNFSIMSLVLAGGAACLLLIARVETN